MPIATVADVEAASRILIYGVTGSGKSTAALQIGDALELPAHLVDEEIGWLGNWVNRSEAEMRRLAGNVVASERWVLDSAYGSFLDLVMERVDVVIALDYPRWISLQRLLRRTWRRARTRETVCNGNVETWRRVFSNESIIRWHFRSYASKTSRIDAMEAAPEGPPLLRLRHPRDYSRLLERLRR